MGDFTLSGYRNLETQLKELADAEQDPFLLAIAVADTIVDGVPKAQTLNTIAKDCLEAGQKQKAELALTRAFDATKIIRTTNPEKATAAAVILARISILYDDAGRN